MTRRSKEIDWNKKTNGGRYVYMLAAVFFGALYAHNAQWSFGVAIAAGCGIGFMASVADVVWLAITED